MPNVWDRFGTLLQHIKVFTGYTIAITKLVARPVLFLSPWLVSVFIFGAFLASPQGVALAEQYSQEPRSFGVVIAVVCITWLLVATASLVALVALHSTEPPQTVQKQAPSISASATVFVSGSWVTMLSIAFASLLAHATTSWSLWVIAAVLGLITFFVTVWLAWSANEKDSSAVQALRTINRHRLVLALLTLLLAIGPLAIGAWISISQPMRLADAGPILVAMIGLVAVSTLFGVTLIVIPIFLRHPLMGLFLLLVLAGWASIQSLPIDRENLLLREAAKNAYSAHRNDKSCKPTPSSLDFSIDDHTDHPRPNKTLTRDENTDRSVYLVSAEGGGIRAAYWTAMSLEHLDIATSGNFAQEVASLSGVSGGSLGIATWLATRDRVDLDSTARLELIAQYLGSDFLSPLLGGFLFLDAPRFLLGPLWPSVRRDQVFEKALVDQWQLLGRTDFFARPMLDLCIRGFEKVPAIFFNTTDVQTGEYVALTTAEFRYSPTLTGTLISAPGFDFEHTSLDDATVSQMVHISARFPYLSPPAQVGVDATLNMRVDEDIEHFERSPKSWDEGLWSRKWVLVDGGYFDNTALTPTNAALSYIAKERADEPNPRAKQPWRYTRTKVHVVYISNNPGVTCSVLPEGWRDHLTANARRYLELSVWQVQCKEEIVELEDSVYAHPLLALIAPMQAILAVRNAHSRKTVEILKANIASESPRHDNLEELSLREELYFLRTPIFKWSGFSLLEIAGLGPTEPGKPDELLVEQKIAWLHSRIRESMEHREIDQATADEQLKVVSAWGEVMLREAIRSKCNSQYAPLAPPLGWTLSKSNQELVRCLSLRMDLGRGPYE